jgi:hypothetical protein
MGRGKGNRNKKAAATPPQPRPTPEGEIEEGVEWAYINGTWSLEPCVKKPHRSVFDTMMDELSKNLEQTYKDEEAKAQSRNKGRGRF